MGFHKNGRIIWGVCSLIVLIMTACVIWASNRWGIVGITASFLLSICVIQVYKIFYEWYAIRGEHNFRKVKKCTNCWIIYLIIDIALVVGWLFSTLILMAVDGTWGISRFAYCAIIIVLAVLLTLKPILPFVKKEKYPWNKRYSASLINAFVPRFVILYTFVVFYILSFANFTSSKDIIPSLCVVYIGIERLILMFDTIKEYSELEYKSLFRDTARWIYKQRKR